MVAALKAPDRLRCRLTRPRCEPPWSRFRPKSVEILQPLTSVDLSQMKYYASVQGTACGVSALIARTGYTGEDGFELFVDWGDAETVWNSLLEAGAPVGVLPVGLGARDTLRLEAGMPLYGQELDRDTTPFEAGLGRVVKFDKPDAFNGRGALEAARDAPRKALVGLRLTGRGIARTGYPVYLPGANEAAGIVTSGTSHPPSAPRSRWPSCQSARPSDRRSKSAFATSASPRKSWRCRSTVARPD